MASSFARPIWHLSFRYAHQNCGSHNWLVIAKALNNDSACSVLFLSMTGLFPVRRKILEHSCSNVFLSAGNNPGVFENGTEHAEPLFITFRQFRASVRILSTSENQSDCENLVKNCLNSTHLQNKRGRWFRAHRSFENR